MQPQVSQPNAAAPSPESVTVVVPSYRRPAALRACLAGLAAQSRPAEQVVVVLRRDDTDSQAAVADWLAETGKLRDQLQVVFVERPGQIPALNAGLRAARGTIVCFTDDDCVPRPDWLARLLGHYSDPLVGGAGGRDLVHQDGRPVEAKVRVVGKYWWFGRPIGNHHLSYAPGRPVTVDILKGANMSFRRSLLPFFDETLQMGAAQYNDLDVSLAVRRRGYKIVYDPLAIVDHFPAPRHGEATRDYDAPGMLYAEGHNWMYVALKHAAWWQVPCVILYGWAVGHARAYGLLRALVGMLEVGPVRAAYRLWHAWRGKWGGLCSWLRRGRSR
jgi:cellulose synthase/poly-beta-1,6-N-acetylglucosamine synthase-like glycosyltransferase